MKLRACVAAFALASAAPAFAAERPHIVLVEAVTGLPGADSSAVRAFDAGLLEAFEPDYYLTQGATEGVRRVSPALTNRFRPVHGDPFGDEWRVRVAVSLDSMPRLIVRVTVLAPEGSASAGPDPATEELSLAEPSEDRAAWFSQAGRAAGLLAVEALHRRSGDLAADTRIRVDAAVRRPARSTRAGPGR